MLIVDPLSMLSFDNLDPMTLILKLDLSMVNMYHHTKNHPKVIARTDRYDRHDANITLTAYAEGNRLNYSLRAAFKYKVVFPSVRVVL